MKLTVKEICDQYNLCTKTVYRAIKSNDLVVSETKGGMFFIQKKEVERWIKSK